MKTFNDLFDEISSSNAYDTSKIKFHYLEGTSLRPVEYSDLSYNPVMKMYIIERITFDEVQTVYVADFRFYAVTYGKKVIYDKRRILEKTNPRVDVRLFLGS